MLEVNSQNNLQTERKFSFGFWLLICVLLAGADQLAKYLVEQHHWKIFRNENFAFSIPLPVWLMYIIYAVVFIVVLRTIITQWQRLTALSKFGWALVLAGGISNVLERVILGNVRDFIFIANGIFNLADFFIIVGLLIVVFYNPKKL